ISCSVAIRRERSSYISRGDSFPTQVERHVQPNGEAIVERNQGPIRGRVPCAPPERDHVRFSVLQHITQRERFHLSKGIFAILFNDFGGRSFLALSDEGIQIDPAAVEFARDFICDGGLAASHETKNDNAARTHRSVTDSSKSKNSGNETPTQSASFISVSPS